MADNIVRLHLSGSSFEINKLVVTNELQANINQNNLSNLEVRETMTTV